jgi:hypothetical protein
MQTLTKISGPTLKNNIIFRCKKYAALNFRFIFKVWLAIYKLQYYIVGYILEWADVGTRPKVRLYMVFKKKSGK